MIYKVILNHGGKLLSGIVDLCPGAKVPRFIREAVYDLYPSLGYEIGFSLARTPGGVVRSWTVDGKFAVAVIVQDLMVGEVVPEAVDSLDEFKTISKEEAFGLLFG